MKNTFALSFVFFLFLSAASATWWCHPRIDKFSAVAVHFVKDPLISLDCKNNNTAVPNWKKIGTLNMQARNGQWVFTHLKGGKRERIEYHTSFDNQDKLENLEVLVDVDHSCVLEEHRLKAHAKLIEAAAQKIWLNVDAMELIRNAISSSVASAVTEPWYGVPSESLPKSQHAAYPQEYNCDLRGRLDVSLTP